MSYFTVVCLIELEFLPFAHEAIPRGYSEQTVLKEGMFEDLSLSNKQLRFVLIFLMVCLLLNWREMVRQLLNQLKVLVDECKRTFQPWVMKRETVIGKKNCHQILTEVGLKNLFVTSKLFSKINYELYVEHGECSVIISFCSFNFLGNCQL
ncbi:hypothetical protein ACFX13_020465 [Malus domestica]|uniref:uncharacterized protein LOC126602000 isoform X1 n=1 Tax=Malus sylvestris TaxID=3752 RepID=UPI0010AB00B9|nr:uncharacterized protein LOC114821515 isoform X1 [Malus domestica]XP_050124756.1 uncharacterized protein LOC126602000 isoform X1 [Malus sylvestris]